MADTRRTTHDVRPAIEDALGDGTTSGSAEMELRDDGQLTSFCAEADFALFHDLYRRTAGLCFTVMSGSPGGVRGALVPLTNAVMDIGRALAEARMTTQELERSRATLEEARRQLEVALGDARRDADRRVEAAERAADGRVTPLEERIVHLETFAVTTADPLIRRLADFVSGCSTRLTAAVRTATDSRDKLRALTQRDVQVLKDIERVSVEVEVDGARQVVERALGEEVTHLSVDVTPFQREHVFLDERERTQLAVILHRYDTVLGLFASLKAFLDTFEQEREAIEKDLTTCTKDSVDLRKELQAAIALFPRLFDRDAFALGGTTAEVVGRQQRLYADAVQECRQFSGEIARAIAGYRQRYDAIGEALEPMRKRMEELRAFSDLAWFDALPPADRPIIQAAVLAYRDAGNTKLSTRTIAGVLTHAGLLTEGAAAPPDELTAIARIERVVCPELFAPAETNPEMQRKMRTFQLNTRGRYWRAVWVLQHPELDQRIREAWASWERAEADARQQRSQRQTARTQRAAERKAEQEQRERDRTAADAAARMERERPTTIVGTLSSIEQTAFAVLAALLPEPSPSRGQEQLVRCIAAAAAADILPNTQPTAVARAVRQIAAYDPPLFEATTDDGGARLALTAIALRAVSVLPSIRPDRINEAKRLMAYRVKNWPRAQDGRFFHDLRDALQRLPLPMPCSSDRADPGTENGDE